MEIANLMKKITILAASFIAVSASAAPLVFISPNFGANTTTRNNWMNAMSIIAPATTGMFDELADGNISGVANIYPGLTLTSSNGQATVAGGTSLFGGSNPIGTKAVAMREDQSITFSFATPVDYFSYISIDAGSVVVTTTYADASTSVHTGGSSTSSGNSGVFFGLFRNDKPAITSVSLFGTGGDNEWGFDNVEYGTVPEPGSLLALSVGALLISRRKKQA